MSTHDYHGHRYSPLYVVLAILLVVAIWILLTGCERPELKSQAQVAPTCDPFYGRHCDNPSVTSTPVVTATPRTDPTATPTGTCVVVLRDGTILPCGSTATGTVVTRTPAPSVTATPCFVVLRDGTVLPCGATATPVTVTPR